MDWPDGECCSCTLQFLVVSLLLSLVSTLVFSRTGGVLSHLNSLIHRLPRLPLRNLCSLATLAVFSVVFVATDTAFCYTLISLESADPYAALAFISLRTSLISFFAVQLLTLCTARSLATRCLSTTSGPGPVELPGFWDSIIFFCAPSPRKGSGNQQQQQYKVMNRAKFDVCMFDSFGGVKTNKQTNKQNCALYRVG